MRRDRRQISRALGCAWELDLDQSGNLVYLAHGMSRRMSNDALVGDSTRFACRKVMRVAMLKFARFLACVVVVSTPIFWGAPALGAECLKASFSDSVKAGGADLLLNGLGIRKATFLAVKVYVAGLYLPKKSGDAGKIIGANQPWQLVLRFVHDVDASDMRDAFEEGFKKNAGDKLAALHPHIEALNARLVDDFKVGQYLSFTNDAAKGVTVDVNGAGGAAIVGADFASALLSIWIGHEPPNGDLKSGLLGGQCK